MHIESTTRNDVEPTGDAARFGVVMSMAVTGTG